MLLDLHWFAKRNHSTLNLWSSMQQTLFHQLNVEVFHAVEGSVIGIALIKSGNFLSDAGRRMFAVQPVDKRTVVGYYDGSIVYENLSFGRFFFKAYGERMMKVTEESFRKWVNRLSDMETCRNMAQPSLWIFSACFVRLVIQEAGSAFQRMTRQKTRCCKRIGK